MKKALLIITVVILSGVFTLSFSACNDNKPVDISFSDEIYLVNEGGAYVSLFVYDYDSENSRALRAEPLNTGDKIIISGALYPTRQYAQTIRFQGDSPVYCEIFLGERRLGLDAGDGENSKTYPKVKKNAKYTVIDDKQFEWTFTEAGEYTVRVFARFTVDGVEYLRETQTYTLTVVDAE